MQCSVWISDDRDETRQSNAYITIKTFVGMYTESDKLKFLRLLARKKCDDIRYLHEKS